MHEPAPFPALLLHTEKVRKYAPDPFPTLGYSGFPMDLLVWTPQRLREWSHAGDGFARDILERGQMLYEHRHP